MTERPTATTIDEIAPPSTRFRLVLVACCGEDYQHARAVVDLYRAHVYRGPHFVGERIGFLIDASTVPDGDVACLAERIRREVERAISRHRPPSTPPPNGGDFSEIP